MNKVKAWLRNKYARVGLASGALVSALLVSASAAGEDTDAAITTAFTTGFTKMASDALSMIAIIVPIAIGVAGTIFLVKKAMSWFKSIAK